jgi:Poxvirus Late Transcription Factor VLTF3 like
MEARYEERIRACASEAELTEYLLSCVPVIKEYTKEVEKTTTSMKKVANLNVVSHKGVQRNDIYKKYLKEVEDGYDDYDSKEKEIHETPCHQCGAMYSRIFDESVSEDICKECGAVEYVLGDEVGFKEEQDIEKHIVYSYKRENHFNEWISQFQAKESTHVPEDVISKLRTEFRKQKVKDLSEITHEKVKALLKKLNYAKYYEHVPYIATIVSGITPPTMPQELEDKLRLMFHAIQAPFEKHKPANRKNFLSYSFVLYKMSELLGEDQYLPCFPLLKSREKLYVQDQIWKKICEELKWQFIPTV